MTTQSWEVLRKEARRLETEIDSKLVDYSKLLANANAPPTSRASSFDNLRAGDAARAKYDGNAALQRRSAAQTRDSSAAAALAAAEDSTMQLEALLSRLSSVIDALSAGDGGGGGGAHRTHTVQRHSEILNDYNKEFRKTRKSVAALRDSAELFAGAAPPVRAPASTAPAADALHAERVALAGAAAAADAATGAGMSLKEDLERQRAMFASMVERMETMSEGIPAVNRLIGQIRRKKKRDVLIIAIVVATFLFITFSWKIAH